MIYKIVAMLQLARKGLNFWSLYYSLGRGPAVPAGMAFSLRPTILFGRLYFRI